MLALKVVLVRHDEIARLVFDEVDQGIGGEVGAQVGAALAEVAERHQVLVITHLPQIAARADQHLVVRKEARGGIATSDVQPIHGEDRVGGAGADAGRCGGRCGPEACAGDAGAGTSRRPARLMRLSALLLAQRERQQHASEVGSRAESAGLDQ